MATIGKRKRSDWSGVPADVLGLIASELSSVEDHMAVASVCRGWRSAAKRSRARLHRLTPWLMPISYSNNTAERSFYSFTRTRPNHFQIHLPDIRGSNVYGSPFGWLITYRVRVNVSEATINLFNPISRTTIPLPDPKQAFYTRHYSQFCVFKAILTASPADSNCFVVINYQAGKLAFAKPGSDSSAWSLINTGFSVKDFIYFNGKLYVLGPCGGLGVLDLSAFPHEPLAPLAQLDDPDGDHDHDLGFLRDRERYHLLEFGGELCMVVKYSDYYIGIFKIDTRTKEWTPLESLGNSCLLLQDDLTFISILSDGRNELIPGCIYYPNTGSPDKVVPGCIYYPDTTHIVDHDELLIPRCIYYPTRTCCGSPIWSVGEDGPVNLPSDHLCSILYPSIAFTPSPYEL